MHTTEPRRSSRLTTQDSNGRDYLASLMPGWSRSKLEGWITSPTVRPHLQLWYQLCITSGRRFNDAVEWINTGEKGYFYREQDLEEDLLLMCLAEGSPGIASEDGEDENGAYADRTIRTGSWITQELWARTAWRVVHANTGPGQAFEKTIDGHPAACYGFVVDLLTTAFHSIAHRREASCYEWLINGAPSRTKRIDPMILEEARCNEDTESVTSVETASSSTATTDHSSDLDFEHSSATSTKPVDIPKLPAEVDKSSVGAQLVRKWMAGLMAEYATAPPLRQGELRLMDESGGHITGYRRAKDMERTESTEDEQLGEI